MNSDQFSAGARAAKSEVSSLGGIASMISGKMLALTAAATAGLSAFGVAKWGVEIAAQSEMAQASFASLLGNADRAKTMIGDLTAYASKTPYSQAGVRDAAQTLLNFGVNANQVMPTLKMLGDVGMGNEEKFGRIAMAFGQISSTGRLMGQDLLQLINAGFNPLQEISARTGESMAALKARMEAGGISAAEVTQAFQSATAEGGRFHEMAATQSKTLTGLWSSVKDEISLTLGEIAARLMGSFDLKGVLTDSLEWLGKFRAGLDEWTPFLEVVGETARGIFNGIVFGLRQVTRAFHNAVELAEQITGMSFRDAAATKENLAKSAPAVADQATPRQAAMSEAANEFAAIAKGLPTHWSAEDSDWKKLKNKVRGGPAFFDDVNLGDPKNPAYKSGVDEAVAKQQEAEKKKQEWENAGKWKQEREAARRAANQTGAIKAGSAEYFKTIFSAANNQHQSRMERLTNAQLNALNFAGKTLQQIRQEQKDAKVVAVGLRE